MTAPDERPLPLLPHEVERYCILVDGDPFPVETFGRDLGGFGAVQSANRAAALSRRPETPVVRLYLGERFLAAYAHGHWIDPALNGQASVVRPRAAT